MEVRSTKQKKCITLANSFFLENGQALSHDLYPTVFLQLLPALDEKQKGQIQWESSLTKAVQTQGRVLLQFLIPSLLQDLQLKEGKYSSHVGSTLKGDWQHPQGDSRINYKYWLAKVVGSPETADGGGATRKCLTQLNSQIWHQCIS